ncbi:MAG: hypothetical protein ACRCTI_06130 [Beijerinckiaceae bacterium]
MVRRTHDLCIATIEGAEMTFILPESISGKAVWPFREASFGPLSWLDSGDEIHRWAASIAEAQSALLKQAFDLWLLPLELAADQAPFPTETEFAAVQMPGPAATAEIVAETGASPAEAMPALLDKPDGAPDDLLRIKGIGPKLGRLLNSIGVWHYRQIAGWTPAEVAWVNAKIDFNGRIQRENWQAQAAALIKPAKVA